jgi:hypothetical protein
MRSTAGVIDETSRTIGNVNDKYSEYKTKLASAANRLKELKTKMENDDKYIYYSFIFFLSVSGYIFLKRVKVIAITQWFATGTYKISNWIYGTVSDAAIPSTIIPHANRSIPTTTTTTVWTRPRGRPEREYAPTTPTTRPGKNEL